MGQQEPWGVVRGSGQSGAVVSVGSNPEDSSDCESAALTPSMAPTELLGALDGSKGGGGVAGVGGQVWSGA